MRGNFHPSEVTDRIGIKPTSAEMKHEKCPERGIARCSHWHYSIDYNEKGLLDVYEFSDAIISDLQPYRDRIGKVVEEMKLNATLQIVLSISTDDSIETPILGFNKGVIEFLASVGASIDIDTYLKSEPISGGNA